MLCVMFCVNTKTIVVYHVVFLQVRRHLRVEGSVHPPMMIRTFSLQLSQNVKHHCRDVATGSWGGGCSSSQLLERRKIQIKLGHYNFNIW